MFSYVMKSTLKSPSVMLELKKRASSFTKYDLPYIYFSKLRKYQRLLMHNLSMHDSEVLKLLCTNKNIFNVALAQLEQQCRLFKKWQIDTKTIIIGSDILTMSKHTLENRVMFLREIGFERLDAAMISRFSMLIQTPVRFLKSQSDIMKSKSIAEQLLSTMGDERLDAPPLETPSEHLTVKNYHNYCLRWYLQWKLQVPETNKAQMDHIMLHLNGRSFTIVRDMLKILLDDIGFTMDELKEQDYLGNGSPEDLRKIIDDIGDYCGTDFRKLIRSFPKLVRMDYYNVACVINLLHKYDFSITAKQHYPEILLNRWYDLETKLKKLESVPELRVLKSSAHALWLIRNLSRTESRLQYLRYLNVRLTGVYPLITSDENFEKFSRLGIDNTQLKEIGYCLSKFLNVEPHNVVRRIRKHPYWRRISLKSIYETTEYLLKNHAPEDIYDNIQLVLYPKEKIAEVMDQIVRTPSAKGEVQRLRASRKYVLTICLYEIEKEFNFSGDGVWRLETIHDNRNNSSMDYYSPKGYSEFVNQSRDDIAGTTSVAHSK